MKICLFGDAQSVHLYELARHLLRRGHVVCVLSHKSGTIPGVTVDRFHVPPPSLTNPRRWHGRWRHYLRGFLRRFDVINVQFLTDWGFTQELMERGCVVATAWGSDVVPPPGEGSPDERMVAARRRLVGSAAMVTACGATFAGMVAAFGGMARDAVEIVPFGVDLSRFCRPAHRRGGGDRAATSTNPLVGFYKGFREVYGALNWVRAMPLVVRDVPEVRFEMAGEGPQLEACRSLAQELEIDHAITWCGRVAHEAVPAMLSRWDVSVIPSLFEAFGVAALESSAMGAPVVATDVGGLRDTVRHGQTGLLVKPASAEALAQGVVRILQDRDLRASLARAGKAFVAENFAWDEVVRMWEGAYARAVDRVCTMV